MPEEQRRQFAEHVATCATCTAALMGMRRFSSAMLELKQTEPSSEAYERFHIAVRVGRDERMLMRWVTQITGIAAAVLIAGTLWLTMTPDSSAAQPLMAWESVAANPNTARADAINASSEV